MHLYLNRIKAVAKLPKKAVQLVDPFVHLKLLPDDACVNPLRGLPILHAL